MGLRVTNLVTGTAPTARVSASERRAQLERLHDQARAAIRAGRGAEVRAVLQAVAGWDDQQRAYQLRRLVAEAAFAEAPRGGPGWIDVFAAVCAELLDALDREPCEPVLLNYAGVFLYELQEFGAAEALFKRALALDPAVPHVRENLAEVRRRKQQPPARLPAAVRARLKALAGNGKRVAARAVPPTGLTLSLCMIVKDEEEMLPGCLEAVRDAVDEIVVVDTGSSDRTVEIARSFGARVVDFPWNGSFSDARNASLEAATGDWILYLDADEHLMPEDAAELRSVVSRTWREAFYLVETNYTGGEESGGAVTHLAMRVFRNRPEYRFEGRIHEQKTRHMPTYLGERFEATTVRLRHYGYLRSRISAKDKSQRNIELLLQERAESPTAFNAFNLGSEYLQLGDTGSARAHLDDAWDAVRQTPGWEDVGYVPLLASRVVKARREAGDFEAARRAIAEGLAAFPDHTDLVFEEALCAHQEDDHATARALAERCLAMGDAPSTYASTVGSGTFLARELLAELADAAGDAQRAIALRRETLAQSPEYLGSVLPLATAVLAAGGTPAQAGEGIDLDRPSALLLFAAACYEAGHAEEAERRFREVLERQPGNSAARVGLVEALLSQRRYAEAATEAALEPDDSPVADLAALEELFATAAAGDLDGLADALVRARERGVATSELTLYGAWRASLAGEQLGRVPATAAPAAEAALEALLRVADVDAFGRLHAIYEQIPLARRERSETLAGMYLRRGFLDSAADEWIAVCREAVDVRALIGLAQVAWAKGLPDDAMVFAEEAVALEPEHAEARVLLASLQARKARAA
ncbi:MAG: glycosyltransferase [Thermoleophilia bacterium]